jgi:hypothetical protein
MTETHGTGAGRPEGLAGEWVPVAEAVRLLPSCRPGKRLALSTIYRWINQGRLDCCRVGRWRFVRRDQLLAQMVPVARATEGPAANLPRAEERRQAEARARWAKAVLDEAGI